MELEELRASEEQNEVLNAIIGGCWKDKLNFCRNTILRFLSKIDRSILKSFLDINIRYEDIVSFRTDIDELFSKKLTLDELVEELIRRGISLDIDSTDINDLKKCKELIKKILSNDWKKIMNAGPRKVPDASRTKRDLICFNPIDVILALRQYLETGKDGDEYYKDLRSIPCVYGIIKELQKDNVDLREIMWILIDSMIYNRRYVWGETLDYIFLDYTFHIFPKNFNFKNTHKFLIKEVYIKYINRARELPPQIAFECTKAFYHLIQPVVETLTDVNLQLVALCHVIIYLTIINQREMYTKIEEIIKESLGMSTNDILYGDNDYVLDLLIGALLWDVDEKSALHLTMLLFRLRDGTCGNVRYKLDYKSLIAAILTIKKYVKDVEFLRRIFAYAHIMCDPEFIIKFADFLNIYSYPQSIEIYRKSLKPPIVRRDSDWYGKKGYRM